jgi:hypothetical protein
VHDTDSSEGWWSELDSEVKAADDMQDLNSLPDHHQQQQQQQQQQQLQDQLDLLCCPETAAAAAADVRTSLFDFVESSPWQLEAQDPPGLACTLYRSVKRYWHRITQKNYSNRHDLGSLYIRDLGGGAGVVEHPPLVVTRGQDRG